ncbi:reductive dehalogenase domain-containing protein [Desulfoluna butyratoxydans]|uniref:Reductive dehalogenase domain n=1 Tax=Desulfoluna butyratoxydans TaxID=231438 RepID=A0A4U8YN47_9BACT|nr:reductive dehalogenase domain-containing protein [Desulfoluna butyratoxydans]VFQ44609.1 reductive dehalogenase domain [Desulfoluna butyratoxydans]
MRCHSRPQKKGANKKERLELPVTIDAMAYKRFHQKDTAFCQAISEAFPEGRQALELLGSSSADLGQRVMDKAISDAGWYMDSLIAGGAPTTSPDIVAEVRNNEVSSSPYDFSSAEEASLYIKKTARFLGADLVGITPYDERWTYASFYNPQKGTSLPPDLPFTPKSVIVMAFEVNFGAIVGKGYSQMAITGASLRRFITNIGYRAFAAVNDVALSVPYGIAAGLGEVARNGLLVTYEYGPRVRIGKVFTELDLACDKPMSFGVRHFCETCMRCADACPGNAISTEKKPSFDVHNECNNPGVAKWAIDAKKCLLAWGKAKSDCATCITSCPLQQNRFLVPSFERQGQPPHDRTAPRHDAENGQAFRVRQLLRQKSRDQLLEIITEP